MVILVGLSRTRYKLFSARRTLDPLKVDAPHLGRRNQLSTFRAYRIERCLHFFEIDLPRARHDLGILAPGPVHVV